MHQNIFNKYQTHHPVVGAAANTTAIDKLLDDWEKEVNGTDFWEMLRYTRLAFTFGWSINQASIGALCPNFTVCGGNLTLLSDKAIASV